MTNDAGTEGQVGHHGHGGDGSVETETAAVNGPEDGPLGWDAVQWRTVEKDVRRLRQRIFAASQAGDLKKVRNLQKMMLRSRANA
ncbi:reverse transcriptase N-terminal domain-containing protein, partial [Streptomyces chiangmaiensis]|uniref:reverse transcriptase N-terminal domain-containing protein n=1 Tax=Streptomyces chiangmaiensis TaxID=766497 RepID=UPI0038B60DCD